MGCQKGVPTTLATPMKYPRPYTQGWVRIIGYAYCGRKAQEAVLILVRHRHQPRDIERTTSIYVESPLSEAPCVH